MNWAKLRLLPYISEGDHSIERIISDTRLSKKSVFKLLESMGLRAIRGETVSFTRGDRLKAALSILKQGGPVTEISKNLTWKDFEGLTSEILEQFGYSTQRNLRLSTPKIEIDVLAVKEGQCLAVDCKQWRRNFGTAAMSRIALQQSRRVKALMVSNQVRDMALQYAIPVIITLYAENVPIIHGVPIVPVEKFSGFLNEIDGYLQSLDLVNAI